MKIFSICLGVVCAAIFLVVMFAPPVSTQPKDSGPQVSLAPTTASNSDSPIDRQLSSKAENDGNFLISSCEINEMRKIAVPTLSLEGKSDICRIMISSLGRSPPIYLLKKLFKLTSLTKMENSVDATNQNIKDIAYQVMNVVEARGQENNNNAISSTLDTIWKIFKESQGHVTFKDLNIQLRASGEVAKTISDDGLLSFSAVIWEEKKSQGL